MIEDETYSFQLTSSYAKSLTEKKKALYRNLALSFKVCKTY